MGAKYIVRVNEGHAVEDYYLHNIVEVLKVLIKNKGRILYVRKNYF